MLWRKWLSVVLGLLLMIGVLIGLLWPNQQVATATSTSSSSISSLTSNSLTNGTSSQTSLKRNQSKSVTPISKARLATTTRSSAADFSVTVEKDYLYNNQSTADKTTAKVSSSNGGTVNWSDDDPSLATINATTGVVTANTQGRSGTVTVTGTVTASDGSQTTASTTIKIGGGLDDQTINEGSSATFKVLGSSANTPTEVTWHQVKSDSSDSVVSSGNTNLSYTTPKTTATDKSSRYYAILSFADGSKITTNKATLTIIYDKTPKVIVTSKMENLTDNNGNTDHELTNVMAGDQPKITGTITDENTNSSLSNGTFSLTMPGDISNTTLYIDGKEYNYGMPIPDGNGNVAFTAKKIDFTTEKSHTFELDFTSNTATNKKFTTNAQLLGTDSSGNRLDTYNGEDLTINFIDGLLHADASDVDFGTLTYGDIGEQITGIIDDSKLLTVTDNRRDKTAQVITLRQDAPFNNGSHDLAATLSLKNGNSLTPLNTSDQQVASTSDDTSVPSMGPDNNQQLVLQLSNAPIQKGNYTTTLDWTITSAP